MTTHVVNVDSSANGEVKEPKEITPADRIVSVDGNVWEWIHVVSAQSPVQPIANLGTSFIEYNPPDFVIEAHKEALDSVETNQYPPALGSIPLKQAISDIYSPSYGRTLDSDTEILVTSGAQGGLLSCVMAYIEAGDEVILLEPVFSMYVYQISMARGTVRYVPLRSPKTSSPSTMSSNDWTLDMEELKQAITPKTKMIILNNPHNPLGKVFTKAELHAIGTLCVSYNLILVSDEVYERIAFQNLTHTRVATLSPKIASHTLTAVSMGKLFNATGWRVGFVIGAERLMRPVMAAHLVLAYTISSPTQEACAWGLRKAEQSGWWRKNADDVAFRVGKICEVLDEIGLAYVVPSGGWFVFANIENIVIPEDFTFPAAVMAHGTQDWKACYFLVQRFGVSSIPGTCFYGPDNAHLGQTYLRLGVCKSDEGLVLARERLLKVKPLVAQDRKGY